MGAQWFEKEDEEDDEAERIEELNYEHLGLMDELKEKRKELEEAEKDLRVFQEDNKPLSLDFHLTSNTVFNQFIKLLLLFRR